MLLHNNKILGSMALPDNAVAPRIPPAISVNGSVPAWIIVDAMITSPKNCFTKKEVNIFS